MFFPDGSQNSDGSQNKITIHGRCTFSLYLLKKMEKIYYRSNQKHKEMVSFFTKLE